MPSNTPSNAGGCAIKAGFFLLRPCGEPVDATCACCQRPVCLLHTNQVGDQTWCTECAATRAAGQQKDQNAKQANNSDQDSRRYLEDDQEYRRSQDDNDAAVWAYQYRSHYYRSHHSGSSLLSQRGFTAADAAAFANPAQVDTASDDGAAVDLFDS